MKKILWVFTLFFLTLSLKAPPLTEETVSYQRAVTEAYNKKESFLLSLNTLSFTRNNFMQAMIYMDIKHPEILFKQVIVESANFSSNFWVNYNNPYGMHYPKDRKTTASSYVSGDPNKGVYYRLSVFDHWSLAILDMKYFQDYWISKGWKIEEVEDYFIFLRDLPYATASHYGETVNSIILSDYINI